MVTPGCMFMRAGLFKIKQYYMIKFIPGVHPTYKEQFDKLTRAYIAGEVDPYDGCACFVGNLLNGKGSWMDARCGSVCDSGFFVSGVEYLVRGAEICIKQESAGLYTLQEIYDLEYRFLRSFYCQFPEDENVIFKAFETTLDLLRSIHESKGEIIDEVPAFTKRALPV